MGTQGKRGSSTIVASVLALLVVIAGLALAACGGESTTASNAPSPTPSEAVSSSTPTPSPGWTQGADPIPAVTYPAQAPDDTSGYVDETDGWEFTPTVDIRVTALGFYDDGQDGLRQAHPVGIFDASNKRPIVRVRVQPDSSLDGAFRWESIKPVILDAGHSYVVAAYVPPPYDPEVGAPEGQVWAPEVRLVQAREGKGGWEFPSELTSPVYLTANFKLKPVSAL